MQAAPIIGLVMSAVSVAQTQVQMNQQRKAAKTQANQAALARQQEINQKTLEQRLKEKQIERERRSAVASSRARLGAGGSGAAVISGLNKNYNETLADSRKGYDMTVSGLNLLNDPGDGGGGGAAQGLALAQGVLGLGKQVAGILE
ncbi:MAG: hypothetical protein P1V34_13810 [Alphaproteobacteria bacterium]|nr:hypothetical protein [Alphaproteobacteria bacterium]